MRTVIATVLLALLMAPQGANAFTTRIISGSPASIADWPATVALQTPTGELLCGGSLIAPQWVLTAGHCNDRPNLPILVITGRTSRSDAGGEVLNVDRRVRQPDYTVDVPGAPRDDLMLLHLTAPSSQPPITLSPPGSPPPVGTLLQVAGWGTTTYNARTDTYGEMSDALQAVAVRIRAARVCSTAYGAEAFHPQTTICASLPRHDACAGDSGGPLVMTPGPTALLIGVVSWGSGCATGRFPGVYSAVGRNRCWIDSVISPPRAPVAASIAEGDGSLTIAWQWERPCSAAAQPTAFRISVVGTSQELLVDGGLREATVSGLTNGAATNIVVTAVNENGDGQALAVVGIPAPTLVRERGADWIGLGSARAWFVLAPHSAELRWRVESGPGLTFSGGPWQSAAPSTSGEVLETTLTRLRPRSVTGVRIVIDDGTTVTSSAPILLERPAPPRAIVGPRIAGQTTVGSTASCILGSWSGTGPLDVRRRWLLNGSAIPGASRQTFAIPGAAWGGSLSCRVTVIGPGGATQQTTAAVVIG